MGQSEPYADVDYLARNGVLRADRVLLVNIAEPAPDDLGSLVEAMPLCGVVLIPAKKYDQAFQTGHDECAAQFAFFCRERRIDLFDKLCKEARELLLYVDGNIARERLMQSESPAFQDGCGKAGFGKFYESIVNDRFEPCLGRAPLIFGEASKAFEIAFGDLLERCAQQRFPIRKIVL
ncbi:hypothetical protein WJ15_33360 [Burkholderia cepacia]|nr:hypothetical protein WJ15_33360 [Burkholderia cepacia]